MADITTSTTTTTSAAVPRDQEKKAPGLTFKRYFTTAGVSPYDELEWELRPRKSPTPRAASSSSRKMSRSPRTGR